MHTMALFQQIGWPEMLLVLGIGVLLFGRRLPEIGRGVGKSIVEFKRGLKDIGDDIEAESSKPTESRGATSDKGDTGGWKSTAPQPLGPGSEPTHGSPPSSEAHSEAQREHQA